MKQLRNLVGACLSAALLAACGGGSNGLSPSTPTSDAASSVAAGSALLPATAGANGLYTWYAGANLYVANYFGNTVTVYAPGSAAVLRTISAGVSGPFALAVGGSGNLFVANASGNTVTVYAPGSTAVLRTISAGMSGPLALTFGP